MNQDLKGRSFVEAGEAQRQSLAALDRISFGRF
jgi:hypothetical protein